jgi:stage V sporulation protein B
VLLLGKRMAERTEAENAGRGVLFIAGAKVYFMMAGAAIEFALPWLLGRFAYGAYGVVAQWVSNVNNVVVTGTIQAVSRYTTADPAKASDVKAAGVRMHALIGLPLALLFAAGAPLWASVVHDPSKTGLFALSAAIIALYAFYSVFVGSANGTRQFHKQAALDVTFMTLRAGSIIGAAALGLGVWGAIGGWVGAASAILVIAIFVVGAPAGLRGGTVAPMARFLGGVALYLLLMNLIMSADQILLKRLSTEWFVAHGAADPTVQADGQVGYYRAVQSLARLPYQLMIAVTFVIFPLVSRATFENDAAKTRAYIRATMRYSLIFAGLMGGVLSSNPAAILDVPFQADFAHAGGTALAFLALGNVAFAVFTIAGTILNGAGRTFEAILVAAVTLLALVAGLWIGIPRAEPGHELLAVCGATTSGAMLLGAILSGVLLVRRFGGFLPPLTAARVALAIAAAHGVGRLVGERGPIVTLAGLIAAALAFLTVLLVTRELGRADLDIVKRVLRRKS